MLHNTNGIFKRHVLKNRTNYLSDKNCGAVTERLRHRSLEQKV